MFHRPSNFRIDRTHPLAKGLVFAGLGGGAGTLAMLDASWYGRNGTLTSMDPPTDWLPDSTLGRWCLDYDNSDDFVSVPLTVTPPFSVACWIKLPAVSDDVVFSAGTAGGNQLFRVRCSNPTSLLVQQYDGSTAGDSITTVTSLTGRWAHLAAVFGANNSRGGYLDAVALNANTTAVSAITVNYFYIGKAGWTLGAFAFNGKIADVLVYDYAIGSSVVATLANPADPMLAGLILPPRRRFWPVTGTLPPITGTLAVPGSASVSTLAGSARVSGAVAVQGSDSAAALLGGVRVSGPIVTPGAPGAAALSGAVRVAGQVAVAGVAAETELAGAVAIAGAITAPGVAAEAALAGQVAVAGEVDVAGVEAETALAGYVGVQGSPPYRVAAGGVFRAGLVAAQLRQAGADAGEAYTAGAAAGQCRG